MTLSLQSGAELLLQDLSDALSLQSAGSAAADGDIDLSSPPAFVRVIQSDAFALAWLAEIELPQGRTRVWTGWGELTTLDGRKWQGLGQWGRIGDIRRESETVSPSFRVELMMPFTDANEENTSSFAAKLRRDFRSDLRGREITIWAQLFNATTTLPVLLPVYIDGGRMSAPEVSTGYGTASISVTVTGTLADGATPPNAYVTNEDQQARYPGDKFLELVPLLNTRTFRWPRS